jgi:hypothetical protein
MLTDAETKPKSAFKNPLLYFSVAVIVATLIVGWILFSRWNENREIERKTARERTESQRKSDSVTLEQLGGKELAIQNFYASPGVVKRGQPVQICYGVANAKTVKLEPQSNPVWPSYSRCVDVTPKKDTVYTLTIEDGAGHTQSQNLEVKVR